MKKCPSCGLDCPPEARFCGSCRAALGEPPGPLTLGAVLNGRYKVEARLGEGGMGSVYLAHDENWDMPVALKVLAPELIAHPTARARMEREGRILARIAHTHVVRVFDLFDEGPHLVLVLEYLPGGSLADLVGTIDVDRAVSAVAGVLEGLEVLHATGLVHRDIKPENILLSESGVPKVADLGIAQDNAARTTRHDARLGTAEYMSPEQTRGAGEVDHRSDLWSVSVVLAELLSGERPFSGPSELDISFEITRGAPKLDALRDRTPALLPVVERGLEKSPGRRFSSAREMLEALRAADAKRRAVSPTVGVRAGVGATQERATDESEVAARADEVVPMILGRAPKAEPAPRAPLPVPEPNRAPRRKNVAEKAAPWGVALAASLSLSVGYGYFAKSEEEPSTIAKAEARATSSDDAAQTPRDESSGGSEERPIDRKADDGRSAPSPRTDRTHEMKNACDSGNALTCFALAQRLEKGEDGPPDLSEARDLYERACSGGAAPGCRNHGQMLETGRGGPRDPVKAATSYDRACQLDDGLSCAQLGLLHAKGELGQKEYVRANGLYEKACNLGAGLGCYHLAISHRLGIGRKRDPSKALSYFQRACATGEPRACDQVKRR